ncbi:MAG: hypothetical protein PHC68_02610 [Syntrophorhabdaceae bacterium]|nr:hypothetical protein [Syntrophorhabdaceae bacterium]
MNGAGKRPTATPTDIMNYWQSTGVHQKNRPGKTLRSVPIVIA